MLEIKSKSRCFGEHNIFSKHDIRALAPSHPKETLPRGIRRYLDKASIILSEVYIPANSLRYELCDFLSPGTRLRMINRLSIPVLCNTVADVPVPVSSKYDPSDTILALPFRNAILISAMFSDVSCRTYSNSQVSYLLYLK